MPAFKEPFLVICQIEPVKFSCFSEQIKSIAWHARTLNRPIELAIQPQPARGLTDQLRYLQYLRFSYRRYVVIIYANSKSIDMEWARARGQDLHNSHNHEIAWTCNEWLRSKRINPPIWIWKLHLIKTLYLSLDGLETVFRFETIFSNALPDQTKSTSTV